MIMMLVFTALYQIALNSALSPLLAYLPKSMDAEERRLLAEEHAEYHGEPEYHGAQLEDGAYGDNEKLHSSSSRGPSNSLDKALPPPPHKKPNFLAKFFRPDKYTDYATMRRLVPKDVDIIYDEGQEDSAYFHPAVKNTTPLLWVPRDPMGISAQECQMTRQAIPMTDDGAYLDEKNKIVWDAQDGRPPIYEDKVYY